ncbi:MAG: cobalamin-dependent protein [Ardenticatenaceae bacterium]|nr:cobalamin-dependent protein [Ardenticatenaceae bacterium]
MMMQRPVRVVVGKPGLDGHDRGAKVVARALMDAGCEVIYTGLHQTIDQIVELALQEDVDVIGLSILSGAHVELTRSLIERLREARVDDVHVVVGGNIPHRDRSKMLEVGAAAVFPTATPLDEIVAFITSVKPHGVSEPRPAE